jgi:hypothetical protein
MKKHDLGKSLDPYAHAWHWFRYALITAYIAMNRVYRDFEFVPNI